jgi:hypothetical protein
VQIQSVLKVRGSETSGFVIEKRRTKLGAKLKKVNKRTSCSKFRRSSTIESIVILNPKKKKHTMPYEL